MPSVATLISRAAARYLGVGPQTIARGVARAAVQQARGRQGANADPPPVIPPPSRLERGLYGIWLAGIVLLVLVVLNADLLLPGRASSVFRLAAGIVLLVDGVGLLPRRSPFRLAIATRLTARFGLHASRMRRSAWKHAIGTGLTLLGLAWTGAGMLDLLRGAIALL